MTPLAPTTKTFMTTPYSASPARPGSRRSHQKPSPESTVAIHLAQLQSFRPHTSMTDQTSLDVTRHRGVNGQRVAHVLWRVLSHSPCAFLLFCRATESAYSAASSSDIASPAARSWL